MVSRWGMTYSNSLDFLYTRFTLPPHLPTPPLVGICFDFLIYLLIDL